jgi:TonB family protein
MSAADMTGPATAPVGNGDSTETPLVRANELDSPVRAVRRAVPPATAEAAAARVGGRAFLNVLVGGDGSVQEVRLMIDPGHGLGEAARRAAQSWSYTAPLREGQAVRVWKTEVVEFEPPADEAGDGAESR